MSNVKIGLQLYSVRDKMAESVENTLRAVKEMGYDYGEFAGYFDHTAEELADLLKKYDLGCVSVHQVLDLYRDKGAEGAEFVKKIGVDFSVIPWYSKDNYTEEKMAATLAYFRDMIAIVNKAGMQMLYHNHDFELARFGDTTILDYLFANVEGLNPEFDTCWIKYAGYEPCDYLKKYAGRYKVVHLKDFTCRELGAGPAYALIDKDGKEIKTKSREENEFRFRPVGAGMQDIPAIIKTAIEGGAEYFIVEQDQSYEQDSLEAAKQSREYLRSIGY
jgi:sugar phosphate isomerase/epimerase